MRKIGERSTFLVSISNFSATSFTCAISSGSLKQGIISPSVLLGNAFLHKTAVTEESNPPLIPKITPSADASSTFFLIHPLSSSASVFIFLH